MTGQASTENSRVAATRLTLNAWLEIKLSMSCPQKQRDKFNSIDTETGANIRNVDLYIDLIGIYELRLDL